LATVRPTGSVSVNATPVSATVLAAGFVTVKLSDEVALSAMLVGLKALLSVGGATTVIVAVLLGAPVPLSLEEIALVVFALEPAVVPVTFTLNVHEALAASVAPDRLTVEGGPITGVIVPPPHEPVTVVELSCRPVGRLSLKAMPVREEPVFGLLMVKVSEVDPLNGMLVAPKALEMVGGETPPVTVSRDTVVALWPSGLVMVTFLTPGGAAVVFRLKVTCVGSV